MPSHYLDFIVLPLNQSNDFISHISILYISYKSKISFLFSCYVIITTKDIFTNYFMTTAFGQHTSTKCTYNNKNVDF